MAFSDKLKANILGSFLTVVAGGVILDAGDSAAATCLLSNPNSCAQTIGDLSFSNFTFSGFTAEASDYFDVSSNDGISATVTLNFVPLQTTNTTGTFGYTVDLLSGRTFANAQAFITGSTLGGASYSTVFSSSGLSVSATAQNGASPGIDRPFTPLLTSQAFTQTFVFNRSGSGNLSTVGASFDTSPHTVPGPLPILGAVAAFGFSRKLRKRIKQAP